MAQGPLVTIPYEYSNKLKYYIESVLMRRQFARYYMADILPIRRKTLTSIVQVNQTQSAHISMYEKKQANMKYILCGFQEFFLP